MRAKTRNSRCVYRFICCQRRVIKLPATRFAVFQNFQFFVGLGKLPPKPLAASKNEDWKKPNVSKIFILERKSNSPLSFLMSVAVPEACKFQYTFPGTGELRIHAKAQIVGDLASRLSHIPAQTTAAHSKVPMPFHIACLGKFASNRSRPRTSQISRSEICRRERPASHISRGRSGIVCRLHLATSRARFLRTRPTERSDGPASTRTPASAERSGNPKSRNWSS